LRALGEKPTQIDMRVHEVRSENFEKFRLTLPSAFIVNGGAGKNGLREIPLLLESIAVSPDFRGSRGAADTDRETGLSRRRHHLFWRAEAVKDEPDYA